jgi:GDPmannose 4,6-dehydratase
LVGDASKAGRQLGWEPQISFNDLIAMMVESDLKAMTNGKHFPDLTEITRLKR